ncbi:ABC-2 family transporter protein [Roseimaritima multifibrata]|uniref:ABC-2 family transporter protein n=1 Tax=Roseimaritima multifibrata TaxID=1930274 RepID=A0A517MEA4_9BACT|nr:ABC transporter permease subunit [Roseimaritima multifibrata]QDS93220.1 ABC-2 family transporter protein [Roseimaritima multifibrata]
MYVFENPVLQRELLVNLRTRRAFLLMAVYQLLLAVVVLIAWPTEDRLDLTGNPRSARKLVDLFFLGQYVIASLMAPSFAAGAISGEKERRTYEMLLASPLRPGAIVLGKMVAALTHLGMLILASLPIIVLCLPLGGISVYEVAAAYVGLIVSVILFGAIGIAASSYFKRTSASLAVSYLVVLALVLAGVLFWKSLEGNAELRLKLTMLVVPAYGLTAVLLLCSNAAARMLYPPDVGSEGKEVVDLQDEADRAVGLVIQRDQFPDRLFAPPKKQQLMADGANPVYDKEIHSEIFSQGTLMLRLVIQISMLLAIPLMAWLLFAQSALCAWYVVYVLVFNILIGPVFLAGSMTSERERETLDLLLTTTITPWQILWGKLIVGFRVSAVLTSFLLWPLFLGGLLVSDFWSNWIALATMLLIVIATCISNAIIAMFCSVFSRKSSISLMTTYALLLILYAAPVALTMLFQILEFSPVAIGRSQVLGIASPFNAVFAIPLNAQLTSDKLQPANIGNVYLVLGYFVSTIVLNALLMGGIVWRLAARVRFGE